MNDPVHSPTHYDVRRFGVECITFARYLTFPAGCAFKYVWRHEYKREPVQDLRKAKVYIDWAMHDFTDHGIHAILPGHEGHIFSQASKHLNGHLYGPYKALKHILYNAHHEAEWAIDDYLGEL
jgi:hypothetical protein